ncbi:cysteine hydrolase family protein [Pseudodonghicola flavimaris]|uniref:Isochorismatase family cysteine hydrolase n=1 Tax=Pseudodonghicola flavimaris TaxID=3050036 RepID=A0ABT7EWX3_9RHOB|nr:isochorismatase family cysteine hydrolase [Pseudodonghicola flavimaris]MDK3016839.1 isochorismatase family cysteine hydrolase [Pseudodonghicola flavimaris]
MSQIHPFEMPTWARDRILARQGCPLVFQDRPASSTALVVVDMQNYFLDPASGASVPNARAIVPNINRLARALRAAGGRVVWIRTLFTEEALETIPHFHRELLTPDRFETRCAALDRDAEGSKLWPALDVQPEDMIVEKTRYSGMIPGAGDMEDQLRAAGIDTLLVTGTMTNACCESTARDAMMRNFRTTMVHDGCASIRDDEHAFALIHFALFFGDVTDTDELVQRFS